MVALRVQIRVLSSRETNNYRVTLAQLYLDPLKKLLLDEKKKIRGISIFSTWQSGGNISVKTICSFQTGL